jgi:hypothetical protein
VKAKPTSEPESLPDLGSIPLEPALPTPPVTPASNLL